MLAVRWRVRPPSLERAASALRSSSPLSVLRALARSSGNLCRRTNSEPLGVMFHSMTAKPDLRVNYQCTDPLAPGPPGVNFPSSDIFSPGTGSPEVADGVLESPIESPDEAQAASSDASTRNRTARSAKRSFTRRTYLCRCLMQAAVSGRFCGEKRR
jgi:hypothetical protein